MSIINNNKLSQGMVSNPISNSNKDSFCDIRIQVSQKHGSLDPDQQEDDGRKGHRQPIPSRIDYNFFNYCSTCELKYPKLILRCKECKQKVRTRPWHRSRIVDRRRI